MKMNQLGNWVSSRQQTGYYSFRKNEIAASNHLSAEAIKKSLQRLAKRRRIAKVNDSFYAIVPTEYMNAGSPPASWFIDDFMASRNQPSYVGLLSAASLHGAAHHQPQEFQVITSRPMRSLNIGRQRIRFFTKRTAGQTPTENIKTPTGSVRVSTAEATALDLVCFSRVSGHLSNVATVLREIAEKMDAAKLVALAEVASETPAVQRLGYLLDVIGAASLADPLSAWLARKSARTVPLRRDRSIAGAALNKKWNILVNEDIEVDV